MTAATDKISRSGHALSSPQRWTDEQILVRYRETDDPELFRVLTERYEQEIYSFLRRFLGNTEMAEDAFQSTFLQLHLKRDRFEAGRKVRPWLYMIATNQAIDLQRRSKRHRMLSLNGVGGTDTEETGKLIDVLLSQERSPLQMPTKKRVADGCVMHWISCLTICALQSTSCTFKD